MSCICSVTCGMKLLLLLLLAVSNTLTVSLPELGTGEGHRPKIRAVRNVVTGDQTKWSFPKPFECKIRYNGTVYLRHFRGKKFARGGNKGRIDWQCYQYTNSKHQYGYAFSRTVRGKQYFLFATFGNNMIRFFGIPTTAENILESRDLTERMIFRHVMNSRLGGEIFLTNIEAEGNNCFFHMNEKSLLTKHCGIPHDTARFQVCNIRRGC